MRLQSVITVSNQADHSFVCFSSFCFVTQLNCTASWLLQPPFGCQLLLQNAVCPVLFLSYPLSHPQVSSIICPRLMLKLLTLLAFFCILLHAFSITKCFSSLLFLPFLMFCQKYPFFPPIIPLLPLPIHAYVCLKQPLSLSHPPPNNTHAWHPITHPSMQSLNSPSSGQLSERYLEL